MGHGGAAKGREGEACARGVEEQAWNAQAREGEARGDGGCVAPAENEAVIVSHLMLVQWGVSFSIVFHKLENLGIESTFCCRGFGCDVSIAWVVPTVDDRKDQVCVRINNGCR